MNIDTLNNSQLILLVLLITLVVSAATAMAALSIVHERLILVGNSVSQPTVVQQTINRIIEREAVVVSKKEEKKKETVVSKTNDPPKPKPITLNDIIAALVRVHHGSQPFTAGIFISSDGMLVVPGFLEKTKRYSIRNDSGIVLFSVTQANAAFSLLEPIEAYAPIAHIKPATADNITLGKPALIFGGFGDEARLHSEIISQKLADNDSLRIRTSVATSEIAIPSAVFVNNEFVGFASNYSGWIPVIDASILLDESTAPETSKNADITIPEAPAEDGETKEPEASPEKNGATDASEV